MKGVFEGASSLNEQSLVMLVSFVSSAGAHASVVGIYAHAGCKQTKENGDGDMHDCRTSLFGALSNLFVGVVSRSSGALVVMNVLDMLSWNGKG